MSQAIAWASSVKTPGSNPVLAPNARDLQRAYRSLHQHGDRTEVPQQRGAMLRHRALEFGIVVARRQAQVDQQAQARAIELGQGLVGLGEGRDDFVETAGAPR
ncbi:MAG: hypothetical protein QM756_16020 [Polyangiaceae bacterium]